MATFVWSNFESFRRNMGLYDVTADFRTGLYSNGSEIGASTSICSCGDCSSCRVNLSDIYGYNYKMTQVNNMKSASQIILSKIIDNFFHYLQESIKEFYGVENVIIFGRNIVIKKPSIDVKAIFSLFESKAIDGGYVFGDSPLTKRVTHFPLQLNELEREILIKFISTPRSSVDDPVTDKPTIESTRPADTSATVTDKPSVFAVSTKLPNKPPITRESCYWVYAKPTRPGETNLVKIIIY